MLSACRFVKLSTKTSTICLILSLQPSSVCSPPRFAALVPNSKHCYTKFRPHYLNKYKIYAEAVWVQQRQTYLIKFWVLKQMGPFITIQNHMGPCRTIWNNAGPCQTILDYRGPQWTVLDRAGLSGTILDHTGQCGTIRGKWPMWDLWDKMGPYEAIYMGP